ncbi:hypothetical protein AAFF_G00432440 [Aldrovandia affinis]|uniref:Uncharacterized protein n=1 Tax=Aldrovandia affinis TaxID=143900 RepID=A0AAD7S8Z0_9TELE|nr:hypothetical protein AAFF_G00432440 [Aldrovandia affinis]
MHTQRDRQTVMDRSRLFINIDDRDTPAFHLFTSTRGFGMLMDSGLAAWLGRTPHEAVTERGRMLPGVWDDGFDGVRSREQSRTNGGRDGARHTALVPGPRTPSALHQCSVRLAPLFISNRPAKRE